jgi:hypothetical protein
MLLICTCSTFPCRHVGSYHASLCTSSYFLYIYKIKYTEKDGKYIPGVYKCFIENRWTVQILTQVEQVHIKSMGGQFKLSTCSPVGIEIVSPCITLYHFCIVFGFVSGCTFTEINSQFRVHQCKNGKNSLNTKSQLNFIDTWN